MTPDDINRIMTEVGPLESDIVEVLRTGDDAWAVRFEAADVIVEFDAASGRLMLSAPIGTPRAEGREATLEALLLYTMIWRDTGGVRMALSGPGGEAVQMIDLLGADIEPRTIVTVAVNLASRSLIWRGMFAARDGADDAPADFSDFSLIRA